MLTNLAYLAYDADGTLVFGVILGTIEGALFVRCAAVDGRVAGGADIKLCELIILDLYRVVRVTLALCLHFLGLSSQMS